MAIVKWMLYPYSALPTVYFLSCIWMEGWNRNRNRNRKSMKNQKPKGEKERVEMVGFNWIAGQRWIYIHRIKPSQRGKQDFLPALWYHSQLFCCLRSQPFDCMYEGEQYSLLFSSNPFFMYISHAQICVELFIIQRKGSDVARFSRQLVLKFRKQDN